MGSLPYGRSQGAPSLRRAHLASWHTLIILWKLCEVRSVPRQQEGAPRPAPSFDLPNVPPDPIPPAALAGPPEVDAHQGAAHSACLLFGSYGCHPRFQSRQCSSAGCAFSAAHFSTRTSWNQPVTSREKYMCGRYRLAPRVRPSRLPRPKGTGSCGPLRCREPPRFVPAPPVAPACARGTICAAARLERCDRRRA